MEGQITLAVWEAWKEDIRQKLAETADNFVYIGFRLKQIRDSGMYDGCSNVFEFAQREYGLAKSTVSRFMAIDERFGDGNGHLPEEMRVLGQSKLAEMLTLSDAECSMITERTTVKEIRELKKLDGQQESGDTDYSPFGRCVIDFFRDKRELLNEIMPLMHQRTDEKDRAIFEMINPSGQRTHSKGIVFLAMYEFGRGISYKQVGKPEPVKMDWESFIDYIDNLYCVAEEENPADTWAAFYPEEAEKVAREQEKEREKVEATFAGEEPQEIESAGQQEPKPEDQDRQQETQENDSAGRQEAEEGQQEPEPEDETGQQEPKPEDQDRQQEPVEKVEGDVEPVATSQQQDYKHRAHHEWEKLRGEFMKPLEIVNWDKVRNYTFTIQSLATLIIEEERR